jgi:hypothetical protein
LKALLTRLEKSTTSFRCARFNVAPPGPALIHYRSVLRGFSIFNACKRFSATIRKCKQYGKGAPGFPAIS